MTFSQELLFVVFTTGICSIALLCVRECMRPRDSPPSECTPWQCELDRCAFETHARTAINTFMKCNKDDPCGEFKQRACDALRALRKHQDEVHGALTFMFEKQCGSPRKDPYWDQPLSELEGWIHEDGSFEEAQLGKKQNVHKAKPKAKIRKEAKRI